MILLIYAAIILGGIGLDQLTKYLAATNLPIDNSPDVEIWSGVLHLRCISNDGAAFGMLDDKRWLFMTVSTVVIIGMLIFMAAKHKSLPIPLGIALSMVISGGIGNMIDRVALGYVVDFIYFVPIDFPCFNVADSFVCIGAVLMFFVILFTKEEKKDEEAADTAGEASEASAAEEKPETAESENE
jgi:signal peptidase II